MRHSDREDFCLSIAAMATTYRQEVTKALYEGYWQGLKDLPLEAVRHAVIRALRESRFLPTVAELRELAGQTSGADRAIRVWDVVGLAVFRHGFYKSVDFDDPLTNATIRNLGGWRVFNVRMEEEDEKWLRKEFDRVYTSLARSGISEDMAGPLIGEHERNNRMQGFLSRVEAPKRIACGLPPFTGLLPSPAPEIKKAIERVGLLPAEPAELAGPDQRKPAGE